MIIFELFNKIADWKWIANDPAYVRATFKVNDLQYAIHCIKEITYIKNSIWDIAFGLNTFHGPKYNITHTGNEYIVFATIVDIIKEFIVDHNPDVITFSAEEPNRLALYRRMVNTLLPDWKTEIGDNRFFVSKP